MSFYVQTEVRGRDIATACNEDGELTAHILNQMGELREIALPAFWIEEFFDELDDTGRRVLAELAALIPGGAA